MTTLDKVKVLLGIADTSKDALLTLLVSDATTQIENYVHTDYDDIMEQVLIELVIVRYNRLKSEGLSSESYSGVSFSYDTVSEANILVQLKPLRRVQLR